MGSVDSFRLPSSSIALKALQCPDFQQELLQGDLAAGVA